MTTVEIQKVHKSFGIWLNCYFQSVISMTKVFLLIAWIRCGAQLLSERVCK